MQNSTRKDNRVETSESQNSYKYEEEISTTASLNEKLRIIKNRNEQSPEYQCYQIK